MNNNVQIRIWANYKDFAEVTGNIPLHILPNDYGMIFSPDRFREIPCENYHSFLYTPEAICINFHTLVPSNRLRTDRVIISLAIRRGYTLELNPTEILSTIRRDFIAFINDRSIFFEADNVNDIENKIVAPIAEWEEKIHAIQDKGQMFINQEADLKGIAFVPFDNNDAFCAYLNHPARPEYKGYRIVFLVANDSKSAFSGRNFTELAISPSYRPTYQVFLTTYSTVTPIATIHTTDERIDVRKEKRRYKPVVLNGSIDENWGQWKISRTADGTGFNLNIPFEPETQVYKLDFQKLPTPFNVCKFKWGVPNTSSSELIISGEELDNPINATLIDWQTDQYAFRGLTLRNGVIVIEWDNRFYYNLADIFDYIKRVYGFTPKVSIASKDHRQSDIQASKQWWDGKKEDYTIIIEDESDRYVRFECKMSTPVNQIRLEKNSGIKIKFIWRDDIEVSAKHPIIFMQNDKEEKRIDQWKEGGVELEFYQEEQYDITLKGYQLEDTYYVKKKNNGTTHYLLFKPKREIRIKSHIWSIIICVVLICGALVGGYFSYPYITPPSTDALQDPTVQNYIKTKIDSVQKVDDANLANIKTELNNKIDSLQKIIAKGQTPRQSNKAEKDAMTRLNSLTYKMADVENAESLATTQTNKKTCAACKRALDFCGGDNKSSALLGQFLQGTGQHLPEAPKKALRSIINNEQYKSAYESDVRNYDNIDKLMTAIKSAVGE